MLWRSPLSLKPFTPQLQTLLKLYYYPALPPIPAPILLEKKIQPVDQEQGEVIKTVYLRPGVDTIYLPLLETLDIAHFIRCRENHALKTIALVAGDIERLSLSSPALSPAAQIYSRVP
jgi:hypothetical protein